MRLARPNSVRESVLPSVPAKKKQQPLHSHFGELRQQESMILHSNPGKPGRFLVMPLRFPGGISHLCPGQ